MMTPAELPRMRMLHTRMFPAVGPHLWLNQEENLQRRDWLRKAMKAECPRTLTVVEMMYS